MGEKRKFILARFRKGGSNGKNASNLLAAQPQDTAVIANHAEIIDNNDNNKSNKNGFLFKKKIKTPNGLEVSGNQHDDVSVMTPVTGIVPDSPDRFHNISLFQPPHPPVSNNNPYGNLYNSSSPSRGGASGKGLEISVTHDDDMSVMTPVSGIPQTPDKNNTKSGMNNNGGGKKKYFSPPKMRMLPGYDDDDSKDLTVYEDVTTEGSGGRGGRDGANTGMIKGGVREMSPIAQSKSSEKTVRKSTISKMLKTKTSWVTRTKYFKKLIDWSFDMIDTDDSGDVSLEELYSGLLLIHLKSAVYVGAPACRPASREYVAEIFHLLDRDNSGTLTKEEFSIVIKILYSQVFTRIIIQWSLTLMIVPLISQYIIKYTSLTISTLHGFWKDIDDDLDPIQRLLWKLWAFFLYFTPEWMDRLGGFIWLIFCKIPSGVWKSLPLTILTLAQTSIAVPYALMRVEDFFRQAAHGTVGETARGKKKVKAQ